LYLDIETSPHTALIWSLWTKYIDPDHIEIPGYTLCFAAKWEGEKKIQFYSVWDDGVLNMVQKAHDLLDEADAVVHYNGTKFDMKMLQTEWALLEIPPPAPYKQIDLYLTVRSQFRLPSNKLDYVCKRFGLGKKIRHKGMELWVGAMRKEEKACREMERYNIQDVRLLPKLYKYILPYIPNHPNWALYGSMDRPVCTNCGSVKMMRKGFAISVTQRYRRYQCKDCGKWCQTRYTNLGKDARDNILKPAK